MLYMVKYICVNKYMLYMEAERGKTIVSDIKIFPHDGLHDRKY